MPLAYSISGAAKACAVKEFQIVQAFRSGKLKVRKTGDGRTAPLAVLATDLQAWLESLPEYNGTPTLGEPTD